MDSNKKSVTDPDLTNPDLCVRIFDVKEIRVLHTEKTVNDHLKNGWILFRIFTENSFIVVRI